jgi:uncharacterized protein DUF1707
VGCAGIVFFVTDDLPGSDALRAGNAEREVVVSRLNEAFGEGRLELDELDQRIAQAYAAKTMGELRPLLADLPLTAVRPPAVSRPTIPMAPRPSPVFAPAPLADTRAVQHVTGRPGWIRWQYYTWAGVVVLNFVIWLTVMLGAGQWIYPWPLWVALPWGAIIFAQDVVARLEYGRRR